MSLQKQPKQFENVKLPFLTEILERKPTLHELKSITSGKHRRRYDDAVVQAEPPPQARVQLKHHWK